MFIAQHKYKPIDLHQMGDADRLNDWMDDTNHSTLLSLNCTHCYWQQQQQQHRRRTTQ
jgi:hypothetical protein